MKRRCCVGTARCQDVGLVLNNFLVGGLEHFLIFHNIWDVILPIDELIFFRGVGQPPTRFCLKMS